MIEVIMKMVVPLINGCLWRNTLICTLTSCTYFLLCH